MTDGISPDEDQKAVALKAAGDIGLAIGTIAERIRENGTIDAELARNALRVSGYRLADLGNALGIPTQTAQEIEERSAGLRAANMRVHELELLLGGAQSPESVQMGLKSLTKRLNTWWDMEGFGHISEVNFGEYGCRARFSCHLFGNFSITNSATPVSDRERKRLWHESLAERGFALFFKDGEAALVDCDASRKALVDLIRSRLPSAQIRSFENRSSHNNSCFILFGVEAFIFRFADIAALPIPEPVAA